MNAGNAHDQHAQDELSQFSATLARAASAPEPENEPLPYFFHALARQRYAIDHCGAKWEQVLPARKAAELASAHRKAAGIDAIAGLLMADHETVEAGSEEPHFTPFMREGLFLALTELARDVHGTLSGIGADLHAATRAGGAA